MDSFKCWITHTWLSALEFIYRPHSCWEDEHISIYALIHKGLSSPVWTREETLDLLMEVSDIANRGKIRYSYHVEYVHVSNNERDVADARAELQRVAFELATNKPDDLSCIVNKLVKRL